LRLAQGLVAVHPATAAAGQPSAGANKAVAG
jgi:hypothetical protein